MEQDGTQRKAEEIAELLRQQIMQGELPAGQKLWAERELAKRFETSRVTAREAVQMLEGEGLVVRHGAKGTFIAKIRDRITVDRGHEVPSDLTLSISALELRASGTSLKVMERTGPYTKFLEQPGLVVAKGEVASDLKLSEGSLVLRCYRLQGVDDQPYRLIESYYPADLFGELLTVDIADKPLYTWLDERHHVGVVRAKESLISRLPQRNEWSLLRISPLALVIEVERMVKVKESGRPVEWTRVIAASHFHRFTYEYDIVDGGKENEYANINPVQHVAGS